MRFKALIVESDQEQVKWEEGPDREFKPSHYEVVVSFTFGKEDLNFQVLQVVLPKQFIGMNLMFNR